MDIKPFAEVLEDSKAAMRHLLLGNGFSVLAHERFSYDSLFNKAFGDGSGHLKAVFEGLGTTDFEKVLRRLSETLRVLEYYDKDAPVAARVRDDLRQLGAKLIGVLTRIHPANQHAVDDKAYAGAGAFLRHFRSRKDGGPNGEIYTTNYDILLYWAMMRAGNLGSDDGFRSKPASWAEEGRAQSVFYLHGALHLYESDSLVTTKVTYANTPLIQQIETRINEGRLPLFVSEGTSEEKRARIERSPYLRHGLQSFEAACRNEEAQLFVFGHALGEQDQHIVDAVREGAVRRLYISTRRPAAAQKRFAGLEATWNVERKDAKKPPVEIVVFPAEEAEVWGPPPVHPDDA